MKKINGKGLSLDRLNLIHSVYRALLHSGRTYAAFEPDRVNPLIKRLSSRETILDPMAGYGTIIKLCASFPEKLEAFCIEKNPPSYLWQKIVNSSNAEIILETINCILEAKTDWPKSTVRAEISESWYPKESLKILRELLFIIKRCVQSFKKMMMKLSN